MFCRVLDMPGVWIWPLAVKLETSYKPVKPYSNHPNYPQTNQTTHKPLTNQPNHPQTSQIPNKSSTDQSKIALFFPWKHFLWSATFSLPIPRGKRNRCIFFNVPARFCISSSPLHSSLPSLIVDYNPSHKLLTQLRTLANFLRRLRLTMLHAKFYEC